MDSDNESDDDDIPQLSAHALAALQDFYDEQKTFALEENTFKIDEDWVCYNRKKTTMGKGG